MGFQYKDEDSSAHLKQNQLISLSNDLQAKGTPNRLQYYGKKTRI